MRCRIPTIIVLMLICICVGISSSATFAQEVPPIPEEPLVVARITTRDDADRRRLVDMGLDLLELMDGDDRFILTTSSEIETLRRAGWAIAIDAVQTALLPAPPADQEKGLPSDGVGVASFRGGYRTGTELRALLNDRAARYPYLARGFVYGKSWEGRDLFGIRLTNTQRGGNKPTLFVVAGVHAREIATPEVAVRFMDDLLLNYGTDPDATWLLDEHLIVIVPLANPDGHILASQGYLQRKNRNTSYGGNCANPPTSSSQYGVDLNRNHSWAWGMVNTPLENKCIFSYPGPTAASEPETQALQKLIASLFPDQRGPSTTDVAPVTTTGILITLHSYGNSFNYPWAYTASAPPNASLSRINAKMAAYAGYGAKQMHTMYPMSGTTDDWAYGELGIPSFTVEIGPDIGTCGGFMPPYSCIDTGSDGRFWPRLRPALHYAARIAGMPYSQANGPTAERVSFALNAKGDGGVLTVDLDERLNGGQNIVAAEYYLDTPPWKGGTPVAMKAVDGGFNGTVEQGTATINGVNGRHIVYVRAKDSAGYWGAVKATWVDIPVVTPPTCGLIIANPANVTSTNGQISVTANNVSTPLTGIAFWVWSESNGNDDLKVYNASPIDSTTWRTTFRLEDHPVANGKGVILVELFLSNVSHSHVRCGDTRVVVNAPSPPAGHILYIPVARR